MSSPPRSIKSAVRKMTRFLQLGLSRSETRNLFRYRRIFEVNQMYLVAGRLGSDI